MLIGTCHANILSSDTVINKKTCDFNPPNKGPSSGDGREAGGPLNVIRVTVDRTLHSSISPPANIMTSFTQRVVDGVGGGRGGGINIGERRDVGERKGDRGRIEKGRKMKELQGEKGNGFWRGGRYMKRGKHRRERGLPLITYAFLHAIWTPSPLFACNTQ